MRRDPSLVLRRVLFYRGHLGVGEDGSVLVATANRFDPLQTLRYDDGTAYFDDGERVSVGWLDAAGPPTRVRVADIRRRDFPQVERLGQLAPLVIEAESGLAEESHAMFFANGIVGIEFNFYGPRPGRIARYLRARCDGLSALQLVPLLRRDVVEQLDRLEDIRLFQVSVLPPYLDQVAETDESLADALRGLAAMGDVGRAEIILRPLPYSRAPLGHRIRAVIRGLAGRRDLVEGVSVLRTAGFDPQTGRVETIDLLRDEFVAERYVPRAPAPSRGVESDAMYAAIASAYQDLRPDLEEAAGAILHDA